MLQGSIVVVIALGYIGLLFLVASWGDRRSASRTAASRPWIYPLSLAVYCTSWTFFGSVGLASRTGFEFLSVYIGPLLVFAVGWPLVIRIARLAKAQNSTSIADFIAARYGKSELVAALVAAIALIGVVPYIALQLKAVSASLTTVLGVETVDLVIKDISFFVAVAMAAFAILFGTRHADATEHQDGLMLAIAMESVVKLVAFLAVGLFVTFGLFGGPYDLLEKARKLPRIVQIFEGPFPFVSFLTISVLSFSAALLLPRQFHVAIVENHSETEIRRAAWLFPIYLVAINLFVVPIAIAGLIAGEPGGDSDMVVLSLPLAAGSDLMTLVAFVGGLSAATAMVIVACVAVAIMVSNHIVMPLVLRRHGVAARPGSDMAGMLLTIRRLAIFVVLLLAYFYYRFAGAAQLAAIGLLSFAAVAQFAPAFFGGMMWRRANARGAAAGMLAGTLVWAYTLLLPSLVESGLFAETLLKNGPWGIALLRPQALFGLDIGTLPGGTFWSLAINTALFVGFSLTRGHTVIERVQASLFVPSEPIQVVPSFRLWRSAVTIAELRQTVAHYLGQDRTDRAFEDFAAGRGGPLDPAREADIHLLRHAEHLLASVIGAASSRLVLSLLLRKPTVSTKAALKMLDDANTAIQYNREVLQTALDHVGQGIAVFDRDLRLICWNRHFNEVLDLPPHVARIGAAVEEMIRQQAVRGQLGPGSVESIVADRVERLNRAGMPFHERLASSGRIVEVTPTRMPDGGVVVTLIDVTESVETAATLERRVAERTEQLTRLNDALAEAKSQADAANLSKTRFLAAASHDVLQPLNAARLYLSSLAEQIDGTDEKARLARNAETSLTAVEEILGALLEISRLDAGGAEPELTLFRIDEMFRQLEIEFAPLARARGLKLGFVSSAATVRSDRRMLRRILQNFVSNAVKYTPAGRILVGCRRHGPSLVIEVHDTGLGIAEAQQPAIFREFQRLGRGQSIESGLGLGLSIVERMARILGHPIRLRSTPGKGSTFAIEVPLAPAVPQGEAIPEEEPAPRGVLAGLTVLAIDNEPRILDGMEALLSGWDCRVVKATDTRTAIAALKAAGVEPDMLLVDYHLDEMTGLEAVSHLRWRFGRALPAALITADRTPRVREEARAKDVQVLNKPLKPAALRAMLLQWRVQQAAE